MTSNAGPRPRRDRGAPGSLRDLPVDPDLDAAEDVRDRTDLHSPFARPPRSRWPRIDWTIVAAVAFGGFFGGIARYEIGLAWPAPLGAFPWAVWSVNTSGAFILAVLLVLVLEVLPPTKYVRAVLATGFTGAFTTFSSVATSADQLAAHGYVGMAAGYVAASVAAGLGAGMLGVFLGRSFAAYREKGQD